MAKEVDEWVEARVAHGEPVGAEEDDVDVLEAEKKTIAQIDEYFMTYARQVALMEHIRNAGWVST